MASPLLGIAGVNSLLFAAYGVSKRIISPFPQLSLKEIALAGAMAGAANAVLASPGTHVLWSLFTDELKYTRSRDVQGAYAGAVWGSDRQAAFSDRGRDVENMGTQEGDYEGILGEICFARASGSGRSAECRR